MLLPLVAFALAAAAPPPLALPLAVDEAAGVARRAAPATASVPLPRGHITAPEAVWLAGPSGERVPLQARALERWPDRSVRWLLLDFLADVPAGGHATYTLRTGARGRAAPGGARVVVRRDGGRTVVDGGAFRLVVVPPGAGPVAELVPTGRRSGRTLALARIGIAGGAGGRPASDRVVVETEGPTRTEVLIRGSYSQELAYELRIAVFAGASFVRLRHTLTHLGDTPYARIRTLALTVAGPFASATVGIDGTSRRFASLDPPHELRHADTTPALVDGEPAGQRAAGWARAVGDGVVVTLVEPEFWQEYPKAFRLARDRVELDLFAADDAPVAFGTGAAKTHESWIAVEDANDASAPADLAAALGAPLVGLPPAAWTAASKAMPDAIDPAAPGVRDFLARLAQAYARYRQRTRTERWDDGPPVPCSERQTEHPRVGSYGALNWGDWQFPGYRDHGRGCDGWGNLEYDLPEVLALGWAATGSRDFYDGLLAAARHYRDVDIAHHWPGHPEWVGFNHPHKASHFALEAPETVDLGHTWTEGLVSFWRLTGETRALNAARGIAEALVPYVERAHNPRQFGWPMLALVAVHGATGEQRYLDAARGYAAGGMRTFRPTPAASDWKMGIFADGLAGVHGVTRDPAIRTWLVAYADALVADPARYDDPRYALPLGYLAALTGNARYEDVARTVARTMKIGEWGKPLAATGRTGFRLLAPLDRETKLRPVGAEPSTPRAVTPDRDAPPRGSPPGRRRR